MIGFSRPARNGAASDPTLDIARLARAAPRPTSIAQTGLSLAALADLAIKQFATYGVQTLSEVIGRLGLPGPVVEQVLQHLRGEGLVEVRMRHGHDGEMRYGPTERGRAEGYDILLRSGYVGPAPIALEDYCDIVQAQSIRRRRIERDVVARALEPIVTSEQLRDSIGPALNSGRAILIHGAPGTGKTCLAQHVGRVLSDLILIPYAIAVNDSIIEIFDPQLHVEVSLNTPGQSMHLSQGWDARYACCQRPVVTAAGELTLEMLEVQRDPGTRTFAAPLQLKANNGVFLIDDLGRQRVSPRALFNRWIVPMEENRDYLSASIGQHFAVPFDQILLFSTNLELDDLADAAFLRRVGYKIELEQCSAETYRQIWQRICAERDLYCDPDLLSALIDGRYLSSGTPMLPCHPRDLIGMVLDLKRYRGEALELDQSSIEWAWKNYFAGHPLPETADRPPN